MFGISNDELVKQLIEKGVKTEAEIVRDGNKMVSPTREEAMELLKDGTQSNESSPDSDTYAISDVILKKGYRAKVDNRIFHIHAPLRNKFGVVAKEAFIEVQNGFNPADGKPIMKEVDALTDLSDRQLKELVYAGVIKLTEKQEKEFGAKFLNPNV